jgi:outer membrane protein W
MRSMNIGISFSLLVCAFATTAFAQDPAPDAVPAADPTTATAAAPAPAPTDTSAAVSIKEAPTGGKFMLGARLGYSHAFGKVADKIAGFDAADMSEYVSGNVPIWLDLGYMVTPNIMVGFYGQYGIGVPASDMCDADAVDCSASIVRLGAQAQYHISPAESIDPWVGLGFGYEWGSLTAEAAGDEASSSVRGFEFVNLQGGADFKLAPNFGLGPFLSFSLGQYAKYSTETINGNNNYSIDETAMHEWLTVGVRGAFTL